MAYATADLDAIIQNLESALASGYAEVSFEGRRVQYRSQAEIRNAIAYFTALYPKATDAPVNTTPKVRTIFCYSSKGFRF